MQGVCARRSARPDPGGGAGARRRARGTTSSAEGHVFATTALDPDAFGTGLLLALVEEYVASRPEVGPEQARAWAAEQCELGALGELFFACSRGASPVRAR